MEVKDIQGKTLIDAPITESAVITEELMKQYSITLGWDAISADVLPLGSYIEHNGVRYSLLAPYSPQQRDETTYEYKPVFEHPVMRWQYLPFFHYTYSGGSIVSKEPDWSLTDNAANFMAAVCAAIKEQTGEDWSYEIADNLPASGDLSFSNTDIFSALTSIAGKFETEWWFDYARKTIYLSKASHGSEVSLEVGRNIGIPSTTQSRDSYATRFYVFGSTRNIEQNYAGSNVNSIVNKRLTLNPAKYPNGYIDIREGLTDSEILVKTLTFDDVYPRSALTISDLKVRLMWRLDSDNQKVQIGTDANGNAVYDQYAIWYFKVPGFSFNKDMVISGKALSVHFNDGPLSGREFELTYHDKDKDVETSDGTSIHVDAGSFEINFVEEGTYIIPSITGLVPVEGNKVTLFNIRMPEEYKSFAYDELEQVAKKEIAKQNEDLSNYSFNSNPVDFFMNNPGLSVGQKVVYKNGSYSYSTRVIKLETQLDRPYEQKITIGSEQIKGNTQTLKEDVVSANQNIDLIASINESTQQLVQSYQKTQKALQESMAVWGNLWKLDPANNAVRTPFNLISDGTIAMKQLGAPGDSEIIGGIQRVRVYFGEDADYIDSDANGNIRLPAYPTALKNPHALKINGVAYDGSKDIEINISANGGIADSVAWENVFGRPTNLSEFTDDLTPSIQEWVIGKHYLTSIPDEYVTDTELNNKGYATENWVTGKGYAVATSVANTYATKTALESANANISNLGTKVATIEKTIETEQGYIDILQGYFTNGIANNAAKLDGQLPSYYATAASVTAIGNRAAALEGYFNNGIAKEAAKVTQSLTFGKKIYNGSSAQSILASDLDAVTIAGAQTITGAKTFSAQLTANEGILVPKGKSVKIGGSELVWDDTMQALKIIGSAYVTGTLAMKQLSQGGTEGGGGTGGATAAIRIMLGEEPYDAKNGVISLPAYPVIPASLKNPYSLTFGSKTYDGSAAKTITASDLGALTAHQDISHLLSKKDAAATYQTIISASNKIAYSNISGTPTSLPASDVSAWAKEATKPSYTFSEINSKPTTIAGYGITDAISTNGGTISGKNLAFTKGAYIQYKVDSIADGTGGWACNLSTVVDTNWSRKTGIGIYGNNSNIAYMYIGSNSYNGNNLRIASDYVSFGDNTIIHEGNYADTTDKRYLALSGGTISNALNFKLVLNDEKDDNYNLIQFTQKGASNGYIGTKRSAFHIYFANYDDMYYNNNTVIHTGNYTTTTDLRYLRVDVGGTITGTASPQFIVNTTSASEVGIRLAKNGVSKAFLGYNDSEVYGAFLYNSSSTRRLGILDDGTPYFTSTSGISTLIHSDNIYLYKSGDSDKLGGLQSKAYARCDYYHSTPSTDNVLTALNSGMHRWGSSATNMPSGGAYGNSLVVRGANNTADTCWVLYGNYNTKRLFYANGEIVNGTITSTWKEVAFTDSDITGNAATSTRSRYIETLNYTGANWYGDDYMLYAQWTQDNVLELKVDGYKTRAWQAKELATARTLWGQSFDGNSNVSGSLSSVGNIAFSSDDTSVIGSSATQARYIYTGWIGSKAGSNFWLAANDGYHLCINYLGNVTIGSSELASSSYKLYIDGAGEMLNISNRNGGDAGLRFSRGNNTSWSVIVRSGNLYITENHSNTTRLLLYEDLQGGGADFAGSIKATSLKLGSATLSYNDKGWLEISGNVVVKGTLGMLELGEGGSASGASGRLVDLTDVTIATPLQGHALIYDEKKGWINGIAGINQAELNQALSSYALLTDVDNRINALINGAPAAYDTLKEIADVLAGNVNSIGDILTALDTKTNKSIKISAGTGLTGGGTLEADRTLSLAFSGVTAGTYRSVTVDTYGRVTAGTNPTTLSGYGITDAKIADGVITLGANTIKPLTSHQSISHLLSKDDASKTYQTIIGEDNKVSFSYLKDIPTTLSGYGITDFVIANKSDSINNYTKKTGIYRWSSRANSSTPDLAGYGTSLSLYAGADTWGQIYVPYIMNADYGIYWRGSTTSSNDVSWRKVLDDVNYTDYVYTEAEIDTKLADYLQLNGGTLKGALQLNYFQNQKANIVFKDNRIGTGGYADSIIDITDGEDAKKGSLGLYGDSSGVLYYYIGHNNWNGANLRIYSDKVCFGVDTIYHSGNFTPSDYLPKSGGILNDSWSGGTQIRRADNNNGYASLIFSQSDGTILGRFGFGGVNNPLFITNTGGYNTLIHSGNYSDFALPLSGGTISGSNSVPLIVDTTATNEVGIRIAMGGTSKTFIGYNPSSVYGSYLYNSTSARRLGILDDGRPYYNDGVETRTLIHSGNIGDYALKTDGSNKMKGRIDMDIYAIQWDKNNTNQLLAPLDADSRNLVYYNGTSWKTIAFTDSNVASADYASSAGSADMLAKIYSENINYAAYSSHLKLIKYSTNWEANGFPTNWTSGLSVMAGYTGWQMVTYGGTDPVNPYFRKIADSGAWSDWKQIAFLDDTVAAANKLVTDNATSVPNTEFAIASGNNVLFGYATAKQRFDTYLAGKSIWLRIFDSENNRGGLYVNSSANVTIGTSDLASTTAKLFVEGVAKIGNTIELIGGTSASARLVVKEVGGDKNFIHMYVDTNNETTGRALVLQNGYGNVGIGTPNPQYKLDVNGNLRASSIIPNADTTNDIGTNSAQYRYIYASWLGSKTGTNLWLAANNAYHLCINTYGNVTIGTSDLAVNNYKLYVNGDTRVSSLTVGSSKLSYNTNGWLSVDTSFVSEKTIGMRDLVNTSDRRLKADIEEISEEKSLSIVRKLRPSTWIWKKDGKVSFGLIAQDVEPIIPAMVVEINSYKHLQYTMLHAFELGAIKKIDSDVEKLKEDLKIANNRIEKLESELKQYRQWQ